MGLCAECVLRQAQSPGGCGGCHVAPFAACAGGGRGFAFDVGVGGGVVKGMTFYGIKRTYQGFARFNDRELLHCERIRGVINIVSF